jgi:diguanylate cyclase (GGDEF)-like protein/PAS domain S-box-containing protein
VSATRPAPSSQARHARLISWGPAIAVFALLAVLWSTVLGFAVVQEQRIVDGAQQQLRLINNAVSQQTRGLLQGVDSNFDVLQHWLRHAPPTFDALEDRALAELAERMGHSTQGLVRYGFVTASGTPAAPTGPGLAGMPAVIVAPQAGDLALGDPVRLTPGGPWHWPLTRRLATPSGEIAALVAWIDLARLGGLHEGLREKPAGAIALATTAGVLLTRTPYIEGLTGRNLKGSEPGVTERVQGAQGSFQHSSELTGGRSRLASFERLGGRYPVTVIVSQEINEALAAFRLRRNLGVAVLAGLTACAIVFSVLLSRSQRAARRSRAEFDAVSDALPLGLFITDTTGAITYANEAYFRTLAHSREQMAWGWTRLIAEQHRERVQANWRRVAATGEPLRDTLTVQQPGGREVVLAVRSGPLHEGGRLVGRVGTIADITDRVQQQRAQRMLTAIFEKSTDVVAQVGANGQMLYLNPAGRAVLGLKPDAAIEHLSFDDFMPAHRETQVRDLILPTAMATGIWVGETSVLDGEGREIDVSEMLIVHRDEAQKVETYSVVMRDITREIRARAELQRSESVLNIVAATLPVLVAVADREQRYLFTNDAFDRWAGRPHDRLVGEHARDVLGEAEYARRKPHIDAALAGQRVMFESGTENGQYFETTYMPFRGADGEVAGLVALSQDITSHKRQHQKLLDASQTDVLTGALNRAGFDLRVNEALERARDAQHLLALLFVDLDRFKPVNDEHGHATGDALLEAVARRLQKALRPSDVLARLGGDEFAVVLPEVKDESAAAIVARKIVTTLGEPFEIAGKRLSIGASVGLALARDGRDTPQSLTERADVALYQAKRAGRGRFEMAAEA